MKHFEIRYEAFFSNMLLFYITLILIFKPFFRMKNANQLFCNIIEVNYYKYYLEYLIFKKTSTLLIWIKHNEIQITYKILNSNDSKLNKNNKL